MSIRPFRFVHASDFHLEQPLMGVAEVPDHLRNVFLDSPYTAAGKVFDAVLAEDADFVVLSGDILHPQNTGPRGPLFLVEQFARLAARGIDVYWAGGAVDPPEAWPAALALPQNVHVFPYGRIEEATILRDGEPLARLLGTSRDRQRPPRPGDFAPDPAGLYTIAVAHGETDPAAMQARAVDYWALGGRHERSTPLVAGTLCAPVSAHGVCGLHLGGPQVVHYCGSPQGRRPEETGVHGCTLVQVDEQCSPHTPCADASTRSVPATERQTRTILIPTDAARWLGERVAIDETTTREDLEMRIRDRMHTLLEGVPRFSPLPTNLRPVPGEGTSEATTLLISWTIAGQGPLVSQLRRGMLAAELLQWLRSDYGYRSPAAWTVSLEVEISETLPPEWYEQETIRGDFLRGVRQLQMNAAEPLALDSYLAETHLAGTLGTAVALSGKVARDRALREAAALGVDLLSGEESHA